MNKVYSRIVWMNYPSDSTPINDVNLNKMDYAINEIDDRLINQDTTKADKTTLNNLISDWTINEETGVITITKFNGEQILFDLNLEKVPVSFVLSDDGILIMTTDDGTTFTANIGAMIPVLTFNDSDEIAVSVSGSGVNKTYSFSIKTGAITEDKLQPNYLADVKVQVENAKGYSQSASDYANNSHYDAQLAQSYAVGGSGIREGEDTDNSKYYYEQTKGIATGDTSDSYVTFTSDDMANPTNYTDVNLLTSGETHSSLFNKVSTMFKNIRYLFKMLGTTDISSIGDGTTTGGISALNSGLSTATSDITALDSNLDNLNASLTFDSWITNGADLTAITSKSWSYSANPNVLAKQGVPDGFSKYGTYFGFNSSNYKAILYQSVLGELAIYSTNNSVWVSMATKADYSYVQTQLDGKQPASTAITTSNIGSQYVNGAMNLQTRNTNGDSHGTSFLSYMQYNKKGDGRFFLGVDGHNTSVNHSYTSDRANKINDGAYEYTPTSIKQNLDAINNRFDCGTASVSFTKVNDYFVRGYIAFNHTFSSVPVVTASDMLNSYQGDIGTVRVNDTATTTGFYVYVQSSTEFTRMIRWIAILP